MRSLLLTWTILPFALSSAAAPLPPERSFRLTVEKVVQSDYCRVVRLKVQARPKTEMMELRHENGASGSVGLASTAKGKAREATMTLASMLSDSNSVYHVTWGV